MCLCSLRFRIHVHKADDTFKMGDEISRQHAALESLIRVQIWVSFNIVTLYWKIHSAAINLCQHYPVDDLWPSRITHSPGRKMLCTKGYGKLFFFENFCSQTMAYVTNRLQKDERWQRLLITLFVVKRPRIFLEYDETNVTLPLIPQDILWASNA